MKRLAVMVLFVSLFVLSACSSGAMPQENEQAMVDTPAAQSAGADDTTRPADGVQAPQLQDADVVISFNGHNFYYEDEAGNQNPDIRVQQGDVVRIEYATQDGYHDFVIDEFGATEAVRSDAGVQILEFTADQTGEFAYYCSVGSHRQQGMEGRFIVE